MSSARLETAHCQRAPQQQGATCGYTQSELLEHDARLTEQRTEAVLYCKECNCKVTQHGAVAGRPAGALPWPFYSSVLDRRLGLSDQFGQYSFYATTSVSAWKSIHHFNRFRWIRNLAAETDESMKAQWRFKLTQFGRTAPMESHLPLYIRANKRAAVSHTQYTHFSKADATGHRSLHAEATTTNAATAVFVVAAADAGRERARPVEPARPTGAATAATATRPFSFTAAAQRRVSPMLEHRRHDWVRDVASGLRNEEQGREQGRIESGRGRDTEGEYEEEDESSSRSDEICDESTVLIPTADSLRDVLEYVAQRAQQSEQQGEQQGQQRSPIQMSDEEIERICSDYRRRRRSRMSLMSSSSTAASAIAMLHHFISNNGRRSNIRTWSSPPKLIPLSFAHLVRVLSVSVCVRLATRCSV
jgi:hypothetical protein